MYRFQINFAKRNYYNLPVMTYLSIQILKHSFENFIVSIALNYFNEKETDSYRLYAQHL